MTQGRFAESTMLSCATLQFASESSGAAIGAVSCAQEVSEGLVRS